MSKVLVSYFSKSGNTRRMAESIKEGLESVDGIDVVFKKVIDTTPDDMLEADGIVLGCPTYFGTLTAELKSLIDKSVMHFGKLNGKVAGAFTSSNNIGGGNETTLLSILQGLLVHGMIVQGIQKGNHYGPVAIGAPDEKAKKECMNYGKQIGGLVKKLL